MADYVEAYRADAKTTIADVTGHVEEAIARQLDSTSAAPADGAGEES